MRTDGNEHGGEVQHGGTYGPNIRVTPIEIPDLSGPASSFPILKRAVRIQDEYYPPLCLPSSTSLVKSPLSLAHPAGSARLQPSVSLRLAHLSSLFNEEAQKTSMFMFILIIIPSKLTIYSETLTKLKEKGLFGAVLDCDLDNLADVRSSPQLKTFVSVKLIFGVISRLNRCSLVLWKP